MSDKQLSNAQGIRLRTVLVWGGFVVVVLVMVAMCGGRTTQAYCE